MLANGVKETTATTGTGTVTLSAVTGFPRFSDAFSTNAFVRYAIQSGDNWEWGIGTIGASNTLARTKILATYVSGVYVNTIPTAITLAGTSTVICAAAESAYGNQFVTPSSKFMISAHDGYANDAKTAVTADRLYLTPYRLQCHGYVKSIGCTLGSGGGTKLRMGLYAVNVNGTVGALLAETANLTPGAGDKIGSITPMLLPSGWYYTAFVCDGTPSASMSNIGSITPGPLGASMGGFLCENTYTYKSIAGWSALPTTPDSLSVASMAGSPRVYLEAV